MNIEKIKNLIEGDVEIDEKILDFYSEDKSIFKIKPKLVIFPKNVEDIKRIVNLAKEEKFSITTRAT